MLNGVTYYGGFDGSDYDFNNRDWEAYETILSGDLRQNDGLDYVFANRADNSSSLINTGSGINASAVLDGFTVTTAHGGNNSFGGGFEGFIWRPDLPQLQGLSKLCQFWSGINYPCEYRNYQLFLY